MKKKITYQEYVENNSQIAREKLKRLTYPPSEEEAQARYELYAKAYPNGHVNMGNGKWLFTFERDLHLDPLPENYRKRKAEQMYLDHSFPVEDHISLAEEKTSIPFLKVTWISSEYNDHVLLHKLHSDLQKIK